jgi:tetratricopeptide (TPR) repeat protein
MRPEHPVPGDRRMVFGVSVFLAVIIFAVFGQAFHFGFVNLDDDLYVTQNPVVQSGLTEQGIARAFSQPMCSFYHPVTILSLMLDAEIYGINAGGFHLTNVVIHAATVVLLFLVLRRMTGAFWPSAIVAAIFAVHPLRVESVAWVAERKDVLGGLFFVLTLWAYVLYAKQKFGWFRYLALVFIFAIGLLAKPTLVTLPFVFLLLDYWPLGRLQSGTWRRLIVEKVPLFGLVVIACVLTIKAEGETITMPGKLPLVLQLQNVLVSYATYIIQTIWPTGFAPFYPYPVHGLPVWQVAGALALLAGITIGVFVCRDRQPFLLVGWLWYVGMLVPMSGLFQVGAFAHADRFTYLPQIGLCVMFAFAAAKWAMAWQHRRQLLAGAALALVISLAVCSWRQTFIWRDSETLWRHTLTVTKANAFAHNNLGAALAAGGRTLDAVKEFDLSLEINPDSAETHFNLAASLAAQNQTDVAIQSYHRALELKPRYPEAENNLGILLAETGRNDEAISLLQRAVAEKPDYAEAENNLGIALASAGRLNDALKSFQSAIAITPGYADAHLNLANALALSGRTVEAIREYQETLRWNPNSEPARTQLRQLGAGQ